MVNCAVIGCCIVDSCVDHWCTDDSWVWRIPKHYTTALLHHNIQHNQLLLQCPQVLHHQGTRVLHNYKCRASLLHRGSPTQHHQGIGVLHHYISWSYERREKVKELSSRVSISVTAIGTAVHYLSITSFFVALQVLNKVNYGVVLLLGVVSLMVGSAMVYRYLLGMVGTNNNIRNNRLLH